MKKVDGHNVIFWVTHILLIPAYIMLVMFCILFIIVIDISEHHARRIPEDIVRYLKDLNNDM